MQVVFIGPPGSGKGTQCQLLSKHLDAVHMSMGDLLREEIAAGSDAAVKAERFMSQGKLAPDDLVLSMLREHLEQIGQEKGLLFDGFPRTVAQAEGLEKVLRDHSRPLGVVLQLVVPEQMLVDRLSTRGREDDEEDTVKTRLGVFSNQTFPVLDYYRDRDLLREIDGVGSEQEVFGRVRACVDACQQKAG